MLSKRQVLLKFLSDIKDWPDYQDHSCYIWEKNQTMSGDIYVYVCVCMCVCACVCVCVCVQREKERGKNEPPCTPETDTTS